MTFRTRILVGFGVVVLVPLALFGVRVRTEMASRLTAEYERRVAALAAVIQTDLTRDGAAIARRLNALIEAIAADNRFRAAVLQGSDRTYLLDYAGGAMRFAGLSMLQIQDDQGRIVSSGHFRNEYDRLEPGLPRALAAAQGGIALIQTRTPEGPVLAIARLDSLRLAGRRFTAAQGGQTCFLFTRQLRWHGTVASLLQGSIEPLGHGTFAQALHRLGAHLEGLSNLGVVPLRSVGAGIGFKQDARLRCLAGGCLAVLTRLL